MRTNSEVDSVLETLTRLLRGYETDVDSLKKTNGKLDRYAERLASHNKDLKTELDAAVNAKNAAIDDRDALDKKLSHAYRVLRDILRDYRARNPESPIAVESPLLQEVQDIVADISDTSSDKTVRPPRTTNKRPPRFELPPEPGPSRHKTSSSSSRKTSKTPIQYSPPSAKQSRLQVVPVRPLFLADNESSGWKVHYGRKAPRGTRVLCGPLSWDDFGPKLDLPEETMHSLDSLSLDSEQCLRLHIGSRDGLDCAFIYDPIFLDDDIGQTTYIVDWGRSEAHEATARYIGGVNVPSRYHTFMGRMGKKKERVRWFYVGLVDWTIRPSMWNIWQSFGDGDSSRRFLVEHLKKRDRDNRLSEEGIKECLDEDNWEQLCIELSGQIETEEESMQMMSLIKPPKE